MLPRTEIVSEANGRAQRCAAGAGATRARPRPDPVLLAFRSRLDMALFTDYDPEYVRSSYRHTEPDTGRRYRRDNLTGPGGAAKGSGRRGHGRDPPLALQPRADGRLIAAGRACSQGGRRTGLQAVSRRGAGRASAGCLGRPPAHRLAGQRARRHPTQKRSRCCERIIKASSKPATWCIDSFCGCATACVAAERLERQWAGIDISPKAEDLVRSRSTGLEVGLFWQVQRTGPMCRCVRTWATSRPTTPT